MLLGGAGLRGGRKERGRLFGGVVHGDGETSGGEGGWMEGGKGGKERGA